MRISRGVLASMFLSGSAVIVGGAAVPADATVGLARPAAFHGGCCESHRAGLSGRNVNPHRQQSRINVINRLQVNNISLSDSNPVQRIDDDRFGISSSAASAGGGGGGGGGGAEDPANTQIGAQ